MRLSARSGTWALFIALFAAELALGFRMAGHNHFMNGDAISRLANAYYILYSRDPHLAAVGFIWNPLPSLLALPILLLRPLFPSLSSEGLAVVLLTAFFAALTAAALVRAFRWLPADARSRVSGDRGMAGAAAIACVLLFALNPFQFWYGANGMSEAIFGCLLAFVVIRWTEWLRGREMRPLIEASVALALAFLTRYEAIPFSAAMALATVLVLFGRRESVRKMESSLIVLLLPVLFAVASWIWLNRTIMGDALYFLTSSYSNSGQSVTLENNASISGLIGDPVASLVFAAKRAAVFLPPFAVVTLFRLRSGGIRRPDYLALAAIVLCIPVFQWYMLMSGSSFGWLRFFYYPLLLTVAWLPYEFSLPDHAARLRGLKLAAIGSLALSAALVWPVMNDHALAPEEYTAIHYVDSDLFAASQVNRANAVTLDRDIFEADPAALILTDSFNAYETILYSNYPARFVNTTDRDFKEALADPLSFKTGYLLLPKPEGLNALNAVNHAYPKLYDGGESWAVLDRELPGGWRLFRVVGHPAPESPRT